MSGSGITPINSGPLIIRTYLDGSANNTYLLGPYDYPISSNRILFTSTNGILTESDNISLFFINASTFMGNTIIGPISTVSTIYTSSLFTSTIISNTSLFSSVKGSTIQVSTIAINSSIIISSLITSSITFSSIIGNPSSILNISTVNVNSLNATNANLERAYITTMNGQFSIINKLSTNIVSCNTISSNILYISSFTRSTFNCGSTYLSTANLSSIYIIGSTLSSNILTVNSTIFGSTLILAEVLYAKQTYGSLPSTVYTNTINGSTLNFSTVIGNNFIYSTMSASTFVLPTSYILNGTYTRFVGSTINTVSLTVSTITSSTLYGGIISYSTLALSSLTANNMSVMSLTSHDTSASTVTVSSMIGKIQTISTIIASTILTSTLFGNSIYIQQLSTTNLVASTIFANTLTYSTINGSTTTSAQMNLITGTYSSLTGQNVRASTIVISSLFTTNVNVINASTNVFNTNYGSISTMFGSTLYLSNGIISSMSTTNVSINNITASTLFVPTRTEFALYVSTILVSAFIASTVNTLQIGTGNNATNTLAGYGASTLLNNTTGSNNTAMGYASLTSTTTGSYNTAIGASTLCSNTGGSYNTAIGAKAGVLNGFSGNYNTYIGYGAVPSQTNVINEIVLGGSSTTTGTNPGQGSNSITIGNPAITTTVLYGKVGIGVTQPATVLDVRGSYQQIGGNMTIYNTSAPYVYVWLYNDNALGCGWFLNNSLRSADGGPKTATLRNDYGTLYLQSSNGNGITILGTSGYIGFNTSVPTRTVDVAGNMNVSGTCTVTNVICSSQLQSNGVAIGTSFSTQWSIGAGNIVTYASGNVAIGSTNPGIFQLNVTGTMNCSGTLFIYNTITTTSSSNTTITCGTLNTNGNTVTTGPITSGTVTSESINLSGNLTATNIVCNTVNGTNFIPSIITTIWYTSYLQFSMDTGNSVDRYQPIWKLTNGDDTYNQNGQLLSSKYFFIKWVGYGTTGTSNTFGVYLPISQSLWNFYSDKRLKSNIQKVESCLTNFIKLSPVTYTFRKDMKHKTHVGFIAQDVKSIFPLLVLKTEPPNNFTHLEYIFSITYNLFIPYYVKSFQEQHDIIHTQQEQYDILYSELQNKVLECDHLYHMMNRQEQQLIDLEQEITTLLSVPVNV